MCVYVCVQLSRVNSWHADCSQKFSGKNSEIGTTISFPKRILWWQGEPRSLEFQARCFTAPKPLWRPLWDHGPICLVLFNTSSLALSWYQVQSQTVRWNIEKYTGWSNLECWLVDWLAMKLKDNSHSNRHTGLMFFNNFSLNIPRNLEIAGSHLNWIYFHFWRISRHYFPQIYLCQFTFHQQRAVLFSYFHSTK